MRRRPLPRPLKHWLEQHGDPKLEAYAVAAYYLQRHYYGLLEANYGVRHGEPRLAESGLATRFVYDLWTSEMGHHSECGEVDYQKSALATVMAAYDYSEDKCKAAIEYEAWVRGHTPPAWESIKRPWPPIEAFSTK